MTRAWLLAAVALSATAAQAGAETFSGIARVSDADTVVIDGNRIRLDAIDAPESAQQCEDAAGKRYACGRTAAQALARKIAGRPVTCASQGRGRWGRPLAICRVGGEDLNAWLVRNGHALAYRRYSRKYVGEEDAARRERAGVWAGRFIPPWDWRRGQRLPKPRSGSG